MVLIHQLRRGWPTGDQILVPYKGKVTLQPLEQYPQTVRHAAPPKHANQ